MTRLEWGERSPLYDLGVDRGVLYLSDSAVPWNGLVSVEDRAVGSIDTEHYFEGRRLEITQVTGDFEAQIAAITYPDAFEEVNGYSEGHQYRRFGMTYRTQMGADDYKLHLFYSLIVRDTQRSWSTISTQENPSLFAWDVYGDPRPVPGSSPSAHLILEVPRDPAVMEAIEDILYGSDTTEPRLPSPTELLALYESLTVLKITYNGNGTYTATGPDDMVEILPDGQFRLTSPSANPINDGAFVVNSY